MHRAEEGREQQADLRVQGPERWRRNLQGHRGQVERQLLEVGALLLVQDVHLLLHEDQQEEFLAYLVTKVGFPRGVDPRGIRPVRTGTEIVTS